MARQKVAGTDANFMARFGGGLICLTLTAERCRQLRLPLIEAVFSRFFNWITAAVIAILISGGFLMSHFGGAQAPWQIALMAAIGVVMMMIFGHARYAVFPRIRRAVQAQRWPDGARAVDTMRRLVLVNLVLGFASRVAPQLSIFSVGMPITLLVGLSALALSVHHLQAVLPQGCDVGEGAWFGSGDWPGLGLPAPVRRLLEAR